MKSAIIFISGGQRSGKSVFAEKMALSMSSHPLYIATAKIFDDDFRKRVDAHKARRGNNWSAIEAQEHPEFVDISGRTVLLDCATLWATNVYFECDEDGGRALDILKQRFDKLASQQDATIIIVSNEIGLGGVSDNAMQRAFADLQGSFNQHIAAAADEAYLVVCGLPLRLK